MIAEASGLDLDDPEYVLACDGSGALRSAASAGAQVRAVASAAGEGELAALAGLRPRAVVLVAARGPAVAAASVAAATLAGAVDVPLVPADRTPEWAGSLDLVVVLGDDPGDPIAATSVGEALRRGAATVVSTEPEGPVGAAAGGGATVLPPRIPVWPAHRFAHHLAVICAVVATARPDGAGRWLGPGAPADGLAALAELLDGEALRDGPRRETLGNPAKTLVRAMLGRDVVVAGDRPAATALAARAAADLLSTGGVVAAGAELTDVLFAPAIDVVTEEQALFHDEQIDGPLPGARRRVFVLAAEDDARRVGTRTAGLPDGEVVVADLPGIPVPAAAAAGGGAEAPGIARIVDAPPEIVQFAVLAVRWQMAAGYVRLAAQADGRSGAKTSGDAGGLD